MPQTFITYFVANVGASAALIGLLFVALSVAPERIFGSAGNLRSRALAGSAFVALLNAFFVSLVALIPGANIGAGALGAGISALINTLSIGRQLWHEQHRSALVQGLALLAGSLAIYLQEIRIGVALLQQTHDSGAVSQLAYLILGIYGISVARTWMLLGAERMGLVSLLEHAGSRGAAPPGAEGEASPLSAPEGTAAE